MKLKYIIFVLALAPCSVFADDNPVQQNNDTGKNVVTSFSYVKSKLDEKQDNIGDGPVDSVITNTGQEGFVYHKGVYKTGGTNTYANQTDSLIEAQTANTAIQNGLNEHVTCYDSNNASDCTLWQIHTLNGTYLPE